MRQLILIIVALVARTGVAAEDATADADSTLVHPSVLAEEPVDTEMLEAGESPWRIQFNTWVWVTAYDGSVGIGDRKADVDASFTDIVDASDSILAFSGRLEVGYGRWGGYIDGFYADLASDDETGPDGVADVDIEMKQTIVDFGVMYRLADWEPTGAGAASPHNAALDLYAGGRYSSIEVDIDPARLSSLSGSEEWIDPIVGARLLVPVDKRWHLSVNGDIGGFGVESDFTWSITSVLGYDFTLFDIPATAYGGYRAIGWDYSDGSGADEFEWDITVHGLLLGLSMRF